MIRVSEGMKYRASVGNLMQIEGKYNELLEKMATQKRINRISDDGAGASRILSCKQTRSSIEQYGRNIDMAGGWLAATESKLNAASDLLVHAKSLAVAQASGTANETTRGIAAKNLQAITDEMRALANARYGERYLFAGTATDRQPFARDARAAGIDPAEAARDNAFDGTVVSGGDYAGADNRTFVMRIVTGGSFAGATYQVSADGGQTWGEEKTDMETGVVDLGGGVTFTFAEGTADLASGDIFFARARPAGRYDGNGDSLTVEVGKGSSFAFAVTGEQVFTALGEKNADTFQILHDLKTALEGNDTKGIQDAIDGLDNAFSQINLGIAECGARANRLEIIQADLSDLGAKLTERITNDESVDLADIATQLASKEVALKAAYVIAGQIGEHSLLHYLG